jgi:hypothetical protein
MRGRLRRIGKWLDTPVVTSRSQQLIVVCVLASVLLGRLPHSYEVVRVVPVVAMLLLILRRSDKGF